jgi:uncharacterized glyoxalase superfamily protein PhnB
VCDHVRVATASIWPIIHYVQTTSALRYLVNVIGFELLVLAYDRHGEVAHAELGWPGGGVVVVGSASHEDSVHGGLVPGQSAQYLVADDVEAVHERVVEAGGHVVEAPHDTRFGNGAQAHVFTVSDTEGNLWTVGDYAGTAVAP